MSTNTLPQTLSEREIDALVAEKVFGYTIRRGLSHYDGIDLPWEVWSTPDGRNLLPVHFSSYIEAAFQVVEKLGLTIGKCPAGWFCERFDDPTKGTIHASPAMAVCLFALRFFGVEVSS